MCYIQHYFSLIPTVTLTVSPCFNLHWNTSWCPDKQTTFGPRPARPISTRVRGGQRRRSTHPPRWDRSNQWKPAMRGNNQKMFKNIKKVQQTLCDKHLSAKLTDYLPSMEQQEDGHRGSHNLLFSPNALYFIRFIKCLPFFSTQNQNKITKSGCLDR